VPKKGGRHAAPFHLCVGVLRATSKGWAPWRRRWVRGQREIMERMVGSFTGILLSLMLSASFAQAQVVLSPGNQSGSPGETVDFQFLVTGPSAPQTVVARFRLVYDSASSPFDPVVTSGAQVACAVAPDLASWVTPGPVFSQPESGRIVVGFGDFTAPLTPFGRAGVVLSCQFTIKPDAQPGTYPLNCMGRATASDASGRELPSSCANGQLVVTGSQAPQGRAPRPVSGGLSPPVAVGGPAPGQVAPGAGTGRGVAPTPMAPQQPAARAPAATPVETVGETEPTPGEATPLPAATERAGGTPPAAVTTPIPTTGRPPTQPVPLSTPTTAKTSVRSTPTAVGKKAVPAAPQEPPPQPEKGGCQIDENGPGSNAWPFLAALVGWLAMRGRRRWASPSPIS
jgi:MYXO-CTERM domain-containing protein